MNAIQSYVLRCIGSQCWAQKMSALFSHSTNKKSNEGKEEGGSQRERETEKKTRPKSMCGCIFETGIIFISNKWNYMLKYSPLPTCLLFRQPLTTNNKNIEIISRCRDNPNCRQHSQKPILVEGDVLYSLYSPPPNTRSKLQVEFKERQPTVVYIAFSTTTTTGLFSIYLLSICIWSAA